MSEPRPGFTRYVFVVCLLFAINQSGISVATMFVLPFEKSTKFQDEIMQCITQATYNDGYTSLRIQGNIIFRLNQSAVHCNGSFCPTYIYSAKHQSCEAVGETSGPWRSDEIELIDPDYRSRSMLNDTISGYLLTNDGYIIVQSASESYLFYSVREPCEME